MRGILIDPFTQTVSEVTVLPGLAGLKEHLQCDWIDIRCLGHDNGLPVDLVVDDEGRLAEGQRCFRLGGEKGVLIAGRGLIMSSDGAGNTVATTLPTDLVTDRLEWMPEGFDYTPPPPVITSYGSFEEMRDALLNR